MFSSSDTILYKKKGFDWKEYIKKQREAILKQLSIFKNWRLYLEIDNKFLEDLNTSRVLPGYIIDSQKHIFEPLKELIEILFCIDANDILENKDNTISSANHIIKRSEIEIWIKPQIVINNIDIQQNFDKILEFEQEFQRRNYKVREKYKIIWYPNSIKTILSDSWFWNDDHIPLNKNLILVISTEKEHKNKTATCLAQIYNDKQIWLWSWYARFTIFPIMVKEKNHPTNIAYQIAIWDNNIIENNNENKTNTENILKKIWEDLNKNLDINEVNTCITNEEVICIASYQEIKRRKLRYQEKDEVNNSSLEQYDEAIKKCEEYINNKSYNLNQKLN